MGGDRMQVLRLTQVGYSLASNPTQNLTPAMKALYYMRRNGNTATDEQLKDYLGNDYSVAIRTITSGKSPAAVAS